MDPRKRYLYVVAESANDLPLGKIIKRKMHENGKRQYYLVERKGEK